MPNDEISMIRSSTGQTGLGKLKTTHLLNCTVQEVAFKTGMVITQRNTRDAGLTSFYYYSKQRSRLQPFDHFGVSVTKCYKWKHRCNLYTCTILSFVSLNHIIFHTKYHEGARPRRCERDIIRIKRQ